MLKAGYLSLIAVLSFSALADVSFDEKKNRIEYLEELSKEAVSMNIEAYRRELQYEKQNLPLETRARNEANLLAEKIRLQISRAYEAAVESKSHQEAVNEISDAIEKDLELVSPDLKEEIRTLSYKALENVERGHSYLESDLSVLENALLKGVKERSSYLNKEGDDIPVLGFVSKSNIKDSEKKHYSSRAEIIESLTSEFDSARFVSTSNQTIRGDQITKGESRINVQLKVNFLGVDLDAGPTMAFERVYRTSATVMAEGMNSVLMSDGNFDVYKRDRAGNVVMTNRKPTKRLVYFTCDAALDFRSVYAGGGGFSIAGVGARVTAAKEYTNSVSLQSRRIAVPETLEGKSVTLKDLNKLCHDDFLKARITNTLDVKGSLEIMMKNVIAGLRFSHPKTKCAADTHCGNWFNKELLAIARIGNVARCVEDIKEKFRSCEARGLKGQNCPVYDKQGKLLSDGKFEFTCDKGLRCVQVQEEGWLKGWSMYQYAKGKCM